MKSVKKRWPACGGNGWAPKILIFLLFVVFFIPVTIHAEEWSKPFNERVEIITEDGKVENSNDVLMKVKTDFTSTRSLSINHIKIHVKAAKIDIGTASQDLDDARENLKFWERILKQAKEEVKKVKLKKPEDAKTET